MISIENIKYSLKNLYARKSRSFLTILSIFLGITTIFIFISFGIGLFSYVNDIAAESGVDKFIVQSKGMGAPGLDTTFKLEEKDLNAVLRVRGVKEASPYYTKALQVENDGEKKFVFGFGTRTKGDDIRLLLELFTVDVLKGRFLRSGDSGKVVLGYNYLVEKKIFENPVDIGEKIKINGKKYEIIGIMESIGNPGDDSNAYITEEDLIEIFPDEELSFGMIFGVVNNVNEIDRVVEGVEKILRKERNLKEGKEDFFVQTYQEAIEQFSNALNIIVGFIILIALISVVVSAINTANTMATSVLERTKEIGIMKSIGAQNSTIRNIFLFESSFLGFVAGILGIGAGWFMSNLGGKLLDAAGWGFLSPAFPNDLFIGLLVFATLVGTISGVTVAIQAARMNAVDSLRYE